MKSFQLNNFFESLDQVTDLFIVFTFINDLKTVFSYLDQIILNIDYYYENVF